MAIIDQAGWMTNETSLDTYVALILFSIDMQLMLYGIFSMTLLPLKTFQKG